VDLWINALWFISLVLSLAVTLVCIVIKQWLSVALSSRANHNLNAYMWSTFWYRQREGWARWNVPTIIRILPLFLHASLFCFLAGLVFFIWPVSVMIAAIVLSMTALLCTFYVFYMLLP
ncbi:hypothetical protein EXIGLDRAFT_598328, partial [Exidia glandulosa HHB12029]